MSFSAKIVADSKNEFGNRITTFVVTFPRIILAEFNTHRMLSKNSASSRAIPFNKMLEAVESNPFIPIKWMKDHRGMQGNEYFEDEVLQKELRANYLLARSDAAYRASVLYRRGLTKQICNRLLEPWMWHTVIVTGTEWDNFFGLRCHEAAEIHMQKIAYMMLDEYNKSTPELLKPGEWHIPYGDQIDLFDVGRSESKKQGRDVSDFSIKEIDMLAVKISTVMAARSSYTVVGADQKPLSYSRMIEIHDDMIEAQPKHMSPFEHCAKAPTFMETSVTYHPEYVSNLKGFIQYRKMIENENISVDPRVIRK